MLTGGWSHPCSARERRLMLTPREAEVLELVAQGYTNKAIAGELGISADRVKELVRSARLKLGAQNRAAAAVAFASTRDGPVDPPKRGDDRCNRQCRNSRLMSRWVSVSGPASSTPGIRVALAALLIVALIGSAIPARALMTQSQGSCGGVSVTGPLMGARQPRPGRLDRSRFRHALHLGVYRCLDNVHRWDIRLDLGRRLV